MTDESNGYERIAEMYIQTRGRAVNGIGASTVRAWACSLKPGAVVLDLGCGTGIPVTKILLDEGMNAYAVDASPKMVGEFRRSFPDVQVACEPVERSQFFNRTFDGIISIGLMFLLSEETQRLLVPKMAGALSPGAKLLFTAPFEKVEWNDVMTEQGSRSLGAEEYRALMSAAGLLIEEGLKDEGGNYYYSGEKREG